VPAEEQRSSTESKVESLKDWLTRSNGKVEKDDRGRAESRAACTRTQGNDREPYEDGEVRWRHTAAGKKAIEKGGCRFLRPADANWIHERGRPMIE
jgi:hypothetical protein